MISIDLSGKVFLVTGGSRGLGAKTVSTLAQAGAYGAINYLDDPEGANRKDAEGVLEAIRAAGGEGGLYAANVADSGQVKEMIQAVMAQKGRLDGLVNNAGILRDRTVKKMSEGEWQSVIDVNLTGAFHAAKYAAEVLADDGRIVNLSSISGVIGFFGQANYAAAKGGLISLTKVLARELAKRRITVNAIAPGLIETKMFLEIPAEQREKMLELIPLARFGQPEDIAGAILYLCSSLAKYVTGQVLHVNGGWYV